MIEKVIEVSGMGAKITLSLTLVFENMIELSGIGDALLKLFKVSLL